MYHHCYNVNRSIPDLAVDVLDVLGPLVLLQHLHQQSDPAPCAQCSAEHTVRGQASHKAQSAPAQVLLAGNLNGWWVGVCREEGHVTWGSCFTATISNPNPNPNPSWGMDLFRQWYVLPQWDWRYTWNLAISPSDSILTPNKPVL